MAGAKFFKEYKFTVNPSISHPVGNISLKIFRQKALERLDILSFLESTRHVHRINSVSWHKYVLEELKLKFPTTHTVCTGFGNSFQELKARHYDRVSHFILAHTVVASKSVKLMAWFIRNEVKLFSIYFRQLTLNQQREFMLQNKLGLAPIENNFEKPHNFNEVYKVPWKFVMPLVATRSCTLIAGNAYVDVSNLYCIANFYREAQLESFLMKIRCFSLPKVKLDCRIVEIMSEVGERATISLDTSASSYAANMPPVFVNELKDLNDKFPPCMARIYNHLQNAGHLRHQGRSQFVPFLKDIGLPIAESLKFFQESFSTLPSKEDFSKRRYEYFIKHQYGLEGRRIAYDTPSCNNIQHNKQYTTLDCHSCPFANINMATHILNKGIYDHVTSADKHRVLSMVKGGWPSEACSALLSAELQTDKDLNIPKSMISPLQYFMIRRMV